MNPGQVVAAIIVDDLGAPSQVLAARRCTPASLAGRWEFPGGKVEAGETAEQALRRELDEELAIEVEIGEELTRPGDLPWVIDEHWSLRLWFARPVGEPAPGLAHDQTRWLRNEQLHDIDWLDTDREVVALLALRLSADLDRT